jgi:hypothetical protein
MKEEGLSNTTDRSEGEGGNSVCRHQVDRRRVARRKRSKPNRDSTTSNGIGKENSTTMCVRPASQRWVRRVTNANKCGHATKALHTEQQPATQYEQRQVRNTKLNT